MGFVDLHVHSNASDGTFSPSQVVELAKNAGLDAFALTDHDTTEGVKEAKSIETNVEVISGVEISTRYDKKEIHIDHCIVKLFGNCHQWGDSHYRIGEHG